MTEQHSGDGSDLKEKEATKLDEDKDTEQEKGSKEEAGLLAEGSKSTEYPILFPDCEVCQECKKENKTKPFFLLHQDDIVRPDGTIRFLSLQNFFKHINALMNVKGGIILIHNIWNIPFRAFDRTVDNRINMMIADATLFHNNFQRVFLDYKHVMVRVKHASNSINVSTFVYHTDLLIHERLADPTQGNMRKLMEKCVKSPPFLGCFQKPYHPKAPDVFRHNEQVHMYQGFNTHLHEANLEVAEKKPGKDLGARLLNYWWENLQLPNYIDSICKLQQGGSMYYGLRAEDPTAARREQERQQEKEQDSDDSSDEDSGVKIRRLSSPPNSESEGTPPERRRKSFLTKFFPDGFKLTESERSTFESELHRKMETEMRWYPYYPRDEGHVADVVFHTVEGGEPTTCLVELQIKRFKGIAFHDVSGPEAYRAVKCDEGSRIERIPLEEYVTMFDFKSF